MKSFDFKKYTPHLLSLAGLLALALYFALPTFRGMEMAQHDAISWRAVSQEGRAWHEKTGENVLWSNSQFGGMPSYTFYVPDNDNFLNPVYDFFTATLPKPANFLALAMVCFYILGSVLRWNRWVRVAGAVAFALTTYNLVIISAGHETKMLAIAFMPAVLAGMFLIFRGRYLPGAALFGLSMALFIMTGHYQINYYGGIALVAAGVGFLVAAIRERTLPRFALASGVVLAAAALAVGVAAVGVIPTAEFNRLTMRGGQSELTINKAAGEAPKTSGGLDKEYAFRWSNGVSETFDLLIPYLHGGGSSEPSEQAPRTDEALGGQYPQLPLYWGPQPFVTGADHYLGAVVCFLAILGLMVIRSSHKWWIAAVSALAILMSLGKNLPGFNYFLFDTLPLLKNFRTPSMVLVIPQLLFPVLGGWGLHEILSGALDNKEVWKKVRNAAIGTGGLCLLLGLLGGMFFDFTNPDSDAQLPPQILDLLKEDRQALARSSALLSAFWIAAAAALLWAYTRGKVKAHILGIGMTALILFDLLPVATRYMNEDNFVDAEAAQATFQPRPVDLQILQDKDPNYRVLDLSSDPFNDAKPAYFHKLVGGYSPAKLESYQDLIDVHLSPTKGFNEPVLRMLNTKYIITPGGQGGQPQVISMPAPAGNGWFVNEVKWVNSADEQMLTMNGPRIGDTAASTAGAFDPVKTAVIRASFKNVLGSYAFGKDSAATVRLKQYGLNAISYTTQNSRPGLAVFSEIWYPEGWKAFVDGKEEPIICANYLLRALKIPAGQHTVEFKFQPASVATGNRITMISSVLVLLLCAAGVVAVFRQKQDGGYAPIVSRAREDVQPTAPAASANPTPNTATAPKLAASRPSKKG